VLPGEGAKYLAKNDEITCGSCTRAGTLKHQTGKKIVCIHNCSTPIQNISCVGHRQSTRQPLLLAFLMKI
jgi:hypothetical protein